MRYIPMTIRGAEKLRKELSYLKYVKRPEIIRSIAEARKYGDLKENAEYYAAKEQQGFCEGRIQNIELKLSYAQIIDVTKFNPSNKVIFGATVIIQKTNCTEQETYCIVGDDEADYKKNLISINSPIARGLIGKKKGDIVSINTPSGKLNYKIINVKYL